MPTFSETVPDFRTITLGRSSSTFSSPKDPQDQAWYSIGFNEPLGSVNSVIVSGTDALLLAETPTLTTDHTSVAVYLTGGTSGVTYGLRIAVTTTGGDLLFRSVSMPVQTQ